MKQKQIWSLVLAFCMVLGLGFWARPAEEAEAAPVFDEKNIVVRFPVMSDIHLQNAGGRSGQHFKKALSELKKYGKMDAILIGGDFVDNGTKAETSAWCNILTSAYDLNKTRLILTMGNHEFYSAGEGENFATHKYLREILGDRYHPGMSDTDFKNCRYHTVINGIHFFALTAYGYNAHNIHVRPEDITWLDKELSKTPKNAPVFITTHPMMKGTQWGSDYGKEVSEYEQNYWVYQDNQLKNVLAKYPQVVIFSGHLHFPLQDERSIWQNQFTAVGTASVSYVTTNNYDADGVDYLNVNSATFGSSYQLSQGMLAEVDKNGNTRLTRLDFANGKTIKTPWVIPAPKSDRSHLKVYTTSARTAGNKAPYFKSGSACAVKKGKDGYEVAFHRAADDDMVCDYLISFYDGKSNKNLRTLAVYNDQFDSADGKVCKFFVSDKDLSPFSSNYYDDFYLTVTARDSFGKKSNPLKSKVYLGKGSDPDLMITEKPRKNWQFKLFTNFNRYPLGHRPVAHGLGLNESSGLDYYSSPAPNANGAATHPAMKNGGFGNSRSWTTKINSTRGFTDYIFMRPTRGSRPAALGAEEFWMWVDCSKVEFESNYVGFRTGDENGPVYTTLNHKNDSKMVYYTLKDGETTWKKHPFTGTGRMNLSGFKGFVRFDAEYICKLYPFRPEKINAFIFSFTPKNAAQVGKEFCIDQIGFAGPEIELPDGTVGMLLDRNEQFDKRQPIPKPEASSDGPSSGDSSAEDPFFPDDPLFPEDPGASDDPFVSSDDPLISTEDPFSSDDLFSSDDPLSEGMSTDGSSGAGKPGAESAGPAGQNGQSNSSTGSSGWVTGTVIGVIAAAGVAAAVAILLFRKKKQSTEDSDGEEKDE